MSAINPHADSPTRAAGFVDLGQLIGATARRKGAAIVLDDGQRAVSYAAVDARANQRGTGLDCARQDGLYDYVDGVKYLIKTGAEKVYPAEIERVLMSHPHVLEAVVVRRPDEQWGEVPVALVCCQLPAPSAAELFALCRAQLARYKQPKEIRFVATQEQFPRSTSGKIQRQELEKWLR